MVKKAILVVLLILPVALCLTSCDIVLGVLSLSPFPAYLTQAVASVDMSSEIETYVGSKDSQWRSTVHVLRNIAGDEYVFLIIQKDFGGQRVYALDTELKLISYDSVGHHYPLALVDANDDFTVGNVKFDRTDMTITTPYFPDVLDIWDEQAFSHVSANRNYLLRSYGDTLELDAYNMDWSTFIGATSFSIGSPAEIWLRGLGFDPAAVDPIVGIEPVYLIFVGHDYFQDSEFLQIVRTPAADYSSGLLTPVFSSYAVSTRVYDVRGWRPCYYTRKGVVAETQNRGRYMLISLDGDVIKRFPVTKEEEPALAFDIDGDYYYIFDEADKRLYRAVTGF